MGLIERYTDDFITPSMTKASIMVSPFSSGLPPGPTINTKKENFHIEKVKLEKLNSKDRRKSDDKPTCTVTAEFLTSRTTFYNSFYCRAPIINCSPSSSNSFKKRPSTHHYWEFVRFHQFSFSYLKPNHSYIKSVCAMRIAKSLSKFLYENFDYIEHRMKHKSVPKISFN